MRPFCKLSPGESSRAQVDPRRHYVFLQNYTQQHRDRRISPCSLEMKVHFQVLSGLGCHANLREGCGWELSHADDYEDGACFWVSGYSAVSGYVILLYS